MVKSGILLEARWRRIRQQIQKAAILYRKRRRIRKQTFEDQSTQTDSAEDDVNECEEDKTDSDKDVLAEITRQPKKINALRSIQSVKEYKNKFVFFFRRKS